MPIPTITLGLICAKAQPSHLFSIPGLNPVMYGERIDDSSPEQVQSAFPITIEYKESLDIGDLGKIGFHVKRFCFYNHLAIQQPFIYIASQKKCTQLYS